jgi:hypothetical protein
VQMTKNRNWWAGMALTLALSGTPALAQSTEERFQALEKRIEEL